MRHAKRNKAVAAPTNPYQLRDVEFDRRQGGLRLPDVPTGSSVSPWRTARAALLPRHLGLVHHESGGQGVSTAGRAPLVPSLLVQLHVDQLEQVQLVFAAGEEAAPRSHGLRGGVRTRRETC
jgi:hypothetical protein